MKNGFTILLCCLIDIYFTIKQTQDSAPHIFTVRIQLLNIGQSFQQAASTLHYTL